MLSAEVINSNTIYIWATNLDIELRGSHDWILVSDERDKKEWVCSICSKSNVVQTIIGLAHQINKPDYKIMDDMNKTNEILMDAVEVT